MSREREGIALAFPPRPSQCAALLAVLQDGHEHEMRDIHRRADSLTPGPSVLALIDRLTTRAYKDPGEWLSRFLDRVAIGNTDQCWPWLGAPGSHGYGMIFVARKAVLAHRVMYEMLRGEIPDGLTVDHLCFNRLCVNPFHVELVTRAENGRRGSVKRWAA